jgi:methyl-accepting chemotaxis protein
MSSRIAGPLYGLRNRLKEFADGKTGLRMHFRNNDEFQSLEATFNLAMENHDLRLRRLKDNLAKVDEHIKKGEADFAKQILMEMQRDIPDRHFFF